MKKVSFVLAAVLAVALLPRLGLAQFMPETGKIDGYMAADYYYVFSHNTGEFDDGGIKNANGFQFRRIYFTYNNKLGDVVGMRLRLEMNSSGDYHSSSSLTPFVKDAYLSFKLGGSASLVAGIQGPPSFELEESVWGWRPLEKTPLDLYKWTSSRDFGVALKGGKTLLYHFMFGQGSSTKSETNKGKKFFGSLAYKSGGFVIEGMGQYESRGGDDDVILKGFAGYSGDWGRLGAIYAYRDYKEAGAEGSLVYNIVSAFAVIKAGEKAELIGRYDMNCGDGYKLDWGGGVDWMPFAPNHEFSWVLGAVSYQVVKNVWIVPNVRFTMYKEPLEGEKAGNDFYGYLTLYFKF